MLQRLLEISSGDYLQGVSALIARSPTLYLIITVVARLLLLCFLTTGPLISQTAERPSSAKSISEVGSQICYRKTSHIFRPSLP